MDLPAGMTFLIVDNLNGAGLVPDKVQLVLQYTACELARLQQEELFFADELVGGQLTTQWKSYPLGGFVGVLFRSIIDYDDWSDCQVNFLMRRDFIEAGADVIRRLEESGFIEHRREKGPIAIPDLFEFNSAIAPHRRPG